MTCVCLITCPSAEVGSALACQLLEERLVACVNLVPGVSSFYWWEGKIQEDSEVLLIAKSTQERVPQLQARLPHLHPYSVPELLVLPVDSGLPAYLQWVEENVAG